MTEAEINTMSLHALRLRAEKTLEEVANEMANILGEESRSHVSVFQIEKRGVDKSSLMAALAVIYGVTREEIEAAATVTKNNFNKISKTA